MSNITSAALFRTIETLKPTLLMDEADTYLKQNPELIGILNSGEKKNGAHVVRTVGDNHEPKKFRTWAPKAIGLIRKLPATLEDRSICIPMQRRRKKEKKEKLRLDRLQDYEQLKQKIARWVKDHYESLCKADPTSMPDLSNDRAEDHWRPLLAIADEAGGDWPEKARHAARMLSGKKESQDNSASELLLEDIRNVFYRSQKERITSVDLLNALVGLEERPWAEWNRGKKITPKQIATRLRPFEIKSKDLRFGNRTLKGYERAEFEDAFSRYLPNDPQHKLQRTNIKPFGRRPSATRNFYVADGNQDKNHEINKIADVADEKRKRPRKRIRI